MTIRERAIALAERLNIAADERDIEEIAKELEAVADEARGGDTAAMRTGVDPGKCDHGVVVEFDEKAAEGMTTQEIRKVFPRKWVECDKCGFKGICYASSAHYIYGDW